MKTKKTKKIAYVLVVLLLLFILSNLYPFIDRERGHYNPTFNFYTCHSDADCLHEIGHASDDSLNWISQSNEYDAALTTYLLENWELSPEQRDPLSTFTAFFPGFLTSIHKENNLLTWPYWTGGWGEKTELYASMLKWAGGLDKNIPKRLREFYNWELINKQLITPRNSLLHTIH